MKHLRSDYNDLAALDTRIPDDEPVFLLRGQDPAAEYAIRAWADHTERIGGDSELVRKCRQWAELMGGYSRLHGKAVADTPAEFLEDL